MKNIYLLYGTNKFLIDYNLKKILADNDSEYYDLESISIQEVLDFARELPMFDEHKYIVCDNCTFLGSSKSKIEHNIDKLIEYLNNPVRTTILVLLVNIEKLDSRKKVNTLLSNTAEVIECTEMNEDQIFKWAKKLFSDNNKLIADELIRHFLSRINYNIDILENEINKLCLIEEDLTINTIDDLVSENIDDNIFSFIDSIINNDKKKMFSIYEESIKMGLEPIQIIVMLSQEFRTIYQVRTLLKMGYLEKDIMSILNIYKIGRIKFARNKAKSLSDKDLLRQLSILADLDISIKTGDIDKFIGFEQYLLNL